MPTRSSTATSSWCCAPVEARCGRGVVVDDDVVVDAKGKALNAEETSPGVEASDVYRCLPMRNYAGAQAVPQRLGSLSREVITGTSVSTSGHRRRTERCFSQTGLIPTAREPHTSNS